MASEQPLGTALDWRPARRPERSPLEGRHVLLRALDAGADTEALYAESHPPAADPGLWTYLPGGPYRDARDMRDALEERRGLGGPTVLHASPPSRGSACGRGVLPAHHARARSDRDRQHLVRRVPAPHRRRHRGDLPARRACVRRARIPAARVEVQLAQRSPRAGPRERFGFHFEGVFRSHMVVKGRNRDTAWYAITDDEWPAVRAGFEAGSIRATSIRTVPAAQTGRADRRRPRLARTEAR